MKALRAALLLVPLMLPVAGRAAPSLTPEEELRAADKRRIDAMVQGDGKGLALLLSEDLTYTHTNGKVETREQFLESISSGQLDYQSIEPSDVRIRVYGATAVMSGAVAIKVRSQGKDLALSARFTSVWVKGDEGWRMVAWQSTRLPEP